MPCLRLSEGQSRKVPCLRLVPKAVAEGRRNHVCGKGGVKMKRQVVVIGAGPGGSSAAYYHAKKGLYVLLVDK
jgi:heterodisulfide reductase subunit A-like polyferredoxin